MGETQLETPQLGTPGLDMKLVTRSLASLLLNAKHGSNPFQILSHLILTTALQGRYCYYPHFVGEENEAQNLPQSPIAKCQSQDSKPGSLAQGLCSKLILH